MRRSNPPAQIGFFEKVAANFLDTTWKAQTGYSTVFMGELVRTFGLKSGLSLMGAMGKTTAALESRFTPTITQLVLGVAGSWNGCRFCGCGHLLAANLVHLRETGALLPIDERMVLEFEQMRFEDLRIHIAALLSAPEFAREAAVLDRLMELELGATANAEGDDVALVQAIQVWEVVNECSAVVAYDLDLDVVPALSTVAKDKPLLRRYRELRGRPVPQ